MLRPVLASALVAALCASRAEAQPWVDVAGSYGLPTSVTPATGNGLVAAVSLADLDGDGDLDLVRSGSGGPVRLYRRDGATFVPDPSQLVGPGTLEHAGHTLFDMDGDGDIDVLVVTTERMFLFENLGGTFVDVTSTHLPSTKGWSSTAVAGDLDGDGDLDLVVARYLDRVDFPLHRPAFSLVLENDGGGRFCDRTRESGFFGARGASFTAALVDLDDDLDLDVVLANDFAQFARDDRYGQTLFRADGPLAFSEVAKDLGYVAPIYGMGVGIADADQDGRLDMVLSNIGEPAAFSLGADGRFVDARAALGIGLRFEVEQSLSTWSVAWSDLDNDGYLDLVMAAGQLGAAAFVGSAPVEHSVILRGTASGKLVGVARADGITDANHVGRDVQVEDLDGDGRVEIIVAHNNGRVAVYRNQNPSPDPSTELTLRPRYTGAGAAGARVVATACGITRTRLVVGGARFGNSDRGLVRLAWPAPCNVAGAAARIDVRWPSGFEQRVMSTVGARTTIDESAWLELGSDAIVVDLGEHVDPNIALALGGVDLGPLDADGAHRWRATWDLPAGRDEGVLDVTLGGKLGGAHPRLRRTPRVPLFVDPSRPIATRTMRVITEAGATVTWRGTSSTVGASGIVELSSGDSAGTFALDVVAASGSTTRSLEVAPRFDSAMSEQISYGLHVLAADRADEEAFVRVRLLDANGARASIVASDVVMSIDGAPRPGLVAQEEGQYWTVHVPHALLEDGDELALTVLGTAPFEPQHVAQLERLDQVGTLVDATRSGCWLVESRLWSGARDRGYLYAAFVDHGGARIDFLGAQPTWSLDGASLVPNTSLVFSGDGFLTVVRAGAASGTASPSLPGQIEAASCPIRVGDPPELTVASATVEMIGDFTPEVGAQTYWRIVPLATDGRSVGPVVDLAVTAEGAIVTPPTYVGSGRYEVLLVPTDTYMIVRAYDGARVIGVGERAASDPNGLVDPAPEASPETVEPDPEPEPEAEVVEPEPEVVEPEPEPEPEVVEPEPEDTNVGNAEDTVVAPDPDPTTTPDPDPTTYGPDPDWEYTGGTGTSVTTSTPDAAAEHEHERRRDDEGCNGGAPPIALAYALFSLAMRRAR